VAAQLGDRIVLGAPVRRIDQSASGVTVQSDKLVVSAQRAIVAIPPTLAGRIFYEPALPPLRDQLTQHMPRLHGRGGAVGQARSRRGAARLTLNS
jgi:monoamine oxidase